MPVRTTTMTVPAEPRYLHCVVSCARELACLVGFSAEESDEIALATEETFLNIVKHGFHGVGEASFDLRCEESPSGLSLTFQAQGMPFDPEAIPQYQPEQLAQTGSLDGLGTFLTRRLMDRVTFANHGRQGYAITLTKYLASPQVDHTPPSASHERPPVKPLPEYTIRRLRSEEALQVARCAFETYGYTYEDYIYHPEQITELNRQGCMHSLVAVSNAGEILGHCALKRNSADEAIAEVGVILVRPEYRQHGLAGVLTDRVLAEARTLELHGVFVRSVAGHAASQRLSQRLGFETSAILLGVFPSKVNFKSLAGTIPEKMSGVLQWLSLASPRPRTVFPPLPLAAVAEQLYQRLAIPYQCITAPDNPPLAETTQLQVTSVRVLDIAIIEILRAGRDLLGQLRAQLRRLCLEQTSVIYLHLDLEDPDLPSLFGKIADLGFFLAGIFPEGLAGRDALVLQYLNNVRIDYERITVESEVSRELLKRIRREDPIQRDLGTLCEQGS